LKNEEKPSKKRERVKRRGDSGKTTVNGAICGKSTSDLQLGFSRKKKKNKITELGHRSTRVKKKKTGHEKKSPFYREWTGASCRKGSRQ